MTSVIPPDAGTPNGDGAASKPPKSTKLVLVRHAVTAQTGPLLSGRTPGIDLSDTGIEQARGVAERLGAFDIAVVYASPIERTRQTAEHIADAHGLGVRELPGVLEADYGEWTGGQIAELAKTDLWKTVQVAPSRARFPGGESISEMQARMVAALETLVSLHPGETIVVVSHADPIKAAIAYYTGLALDLFQRIVVSPASVTIFDVGPWGATLLACNDTGRLEELLGKPEPRAETAEETGAEGNAEPIKESA